MPIKLELKGFKHLKSDKNSTTLKHEKHGHVITLAHKGLSPENQKILEAMGGTIPDRQDAQQSPIDTVTDNFVEGGAIGSSGPTMSMHSKGGRVNNPTLSESHKMLPKQLPSMAIENITSPGDEPGNQGGGMARRGK